MNQDSKDNIKRINEMEALLDECRAGLEELDSSLDHMEDLKEKMERLFAYYGSEEWYEDREMELPPDVKAGVLSEDLVYDAITDTRDAALRMLELATEILRDRI